MAGIFNAHGLKNPGSWLQKTLLVILALFIITNSAVTTLITNVLTNISGALTTFGGFAAQVLDLAVAPADAAMGRRALRSTGYALVSVVACVAVAAAAYALASP